MREQATGSPIMPESMRTRITKEGVIAVIVIDSIQDALPLATALVRGGVSAIELTLRTPVALKAAELIKKEVPKMLVGVGTVLTLDQVQAVTDIGVDFAVSPGCNPKILKAAVKKGLPFAPGIMTPTDIEVAIGEGCSLLKYFPAESSGGLKHLKSMAAPYLHLGLQFIPLGGVNMTNASAYLNSPLIAAIGGSWLAKRDTIADNNWTQIEENAQRARTLVNELNR